MPEKGDGSLIFSVEVDDKRAQNQLNALEKKVKKLQNSIEDMQSKRSPLVEQMQAYGAELDKAKAKLAELKYMQAQDAEVLSGKTPIGDGSEFMRAKARQSALAADIERQEQEVAKLEKTWADVSKQVGFYDEKIKSAQVEIERASEEAAEIVERTNASAQATENMAKAAKKAESGFSRILKRIKGVAMSAFLFSAAYKGFNALSSYLGRMIKTNEKFADSLARIKGNLLTAFQPIYEAVSPALETMLGLVADVTRGIAQFVSVIFGKSVKSSAEAAKKQYEMSDAIESTGEAAEQAKKSLASFDELNILDTSANADVSGVTDAADEIEASFELVEDAATESWVDKLTNSDFGRGFVRFWEKLKDTLTPAFEMIWDGVTTALGWVIDVILAADPDAIEAVLMTIVKWLGVWLAYKTVTSVIDNTKTALLNFGNALQQHPILAAAGIISAIVFALQEYGNYKFNQTEQGKIVQHLKELGEQADEAREKTQSLVEKLHEDWDDVEKEYGGIELIADRFFDLSQKSVLSEGEKTLLDTYREQLEDYAPEITSGIDEITGKWTGTKEELQKVINKQKELYMVQAMEENLKEVASQIWENQKQIDKWYSETQDMRDKIAEYTSGEKYNAYVNDILSDEYKKYLLRYQSQYAATLPGDRPYKLTEEEYRKQMLENASLRNKWESQQISSAGYGIAYKELQEQQKKYDELIAASAALESEYDYIQKYIMGTADSTSATSAAKKAGEAVGTAIGESMIDVFNRIAAVAKKNFGVNLKIPALATGSVIPPNREFLALVGDNKREPEVVSPLSTIRQAVSEALAISGRTGSGNTTVVLEVDGKELGRVIYPSVQGESARLGTSLTNRYQFG